MITIELPHPPSVNTYWRIGHHGRMHISAQGVDYRRAVMEAVAGAGLRMGYSTPVTVHVVWYPPDNRRRDIDNVLKALLDALGAANVYEDDSQVHALSIERGPVTKGGSVVVRVRPLPAGSRTTGAGPSTIGPCG